MKKVIIYFFLVSNLIFITGCWNYHEIEDHAIASSFSVDKDTSGNYLLVAEIIEVNPGEKGLSFDTNYIEGTGKSIFEAARNMISTANKRIYFSHAEILVISQDISRDGIIPILDWIVRNTFPRPTLHIYVSKDQTAREILENENKSTKILTFQFEKVIRSFEYLAKSPHIEVYRVANQVSEDKFYTVLPTVEIVSSKDKTSVNVVGSAFFRGDKLEGFLEPLDTMKYLFIIDEIKQGLLVIDLDDNDNNHVTLQINNNKTKLKSEISEEKITMKLDIRTHVSIAEIDNGVDYTSKEGRMFLKEKAEEFMNNEIENLIRKIQNEYSLDIFEFGDYIRKNNPNLWKNIEKDWDNIFKDLDVVVNTTIFIEGSGHISKSIRSGD